ncbi:uncharacterized protein N7506_000233 [Penicillium brevicompactum]|uniref:uncharacterized protein n=1 Tax=Penicillium brevicompactum TaxID=5074 RepID=UPI002540CDB7|nr:uncharacterized protein N7506_000233 [Penicillium brevicompactum]KAJ5346980.1 hypothetical protein N7506_000233 [Penicillium brevicompactum]
MPTNVHKILMLHGHGQSADIFKPKTRYLRDVFRTLSNEIEFEFRYLSGVLPAYPDDKDITDKKVWGYGEPENDKINGLERSIQHILDTLDQNGPFSGIIGFSSGAAMTAIVTSMLEKRNANPTSDWSQRRHPQLLFAISLSGFKLENTCYKDFYSPKIVTPMLHAVGELDSTVSPEQTRSLAQQCSFPWLYNFFGGHYVPQYKELLSFSQSLASFLREVLGLAEVVQEAWEDIDIVDAKLKPKE